ncbi:flavin reductase family protein [Lutibacter maritimus]|jgi:flavin reductase (DIM6/NTAB) family NADH-FMN oxidoreductase RutF|uniref:NADH-FMN oxidoreductase RutF, flavin reductase (DIM6/NTAB) family n=1 Tax=Lutibacter maritimus TaxID=593133 RepID=A0A1I6QQM0_9FLAO|nr:flavin reductase family protein [Lutibacter maritimus]SFS54618.1 NADH-FMN oxidoreductase RutF, flavin reductase (DIM6/NTAB) family [Lutibacter maritimus]
MLSINPSDISVEKLQTYLQCAVAPRPIAFASTIDENGNPNLSPFSFFNMFSTQPPILIFSPARRVRNNTIKHTLQNVKATKEVVINTVNFEMVQQMSLSSTEYAKGVNEFEKAGFSMVSSEKVKPFRVGESPIQLECKVNNIIELGTEGGAGNLVICEVVKIHINEKYLDEKGVINQHKLDLVARAGGNYYSRAKEGFFEIPKPLSTLGVGVDAIPLEYRNSKVLTGNDLGLLGNVEAIPLKEDVNKFAKEHAQFIGIDSLKKHTFVKSLLEKNDVVSAWKALLMK